MFVKKGDTPMAMSALRCDWVATGLPVALLALALGCAADMESAELSAKSPPSTAGSAGTTPGGNSDSTGGGSEGVKGNPGVVVDGPDGPPSGDGPSTTPPAPVAPWKTLQLSKFAGALPLPADSPVFMFKPQADKLRVLTCDGAGKELAGDGPSVTDVPAAESGQLPVTLATTCVLQVQSEIFWALETLNGEHRIVRIQAREQGTKSFDQWRTPVQFPGKPAVFPNPLAVTADSLVFFVDGTLMHFKWVSGSQDSQSSPRLSLLRLSWNSATWGAPLSAGSDAGSFWGTSKSHFVVFTPKASESQDEQLRFMLQARPISVSPFAAEEWVKREVRAAAFTVSIPAGAKDPNILGRSAVLLKDGLYLTPAAP